MTELILYRLNRVPEKNYLAFLNMIGIRLRSPQPARGARSPSSSSRAPSSRSITRGHADRHAAGGRRRHDHLRDAARADRRRRAARSLLLATSTRPTPTTRPSSHGAQARGVRGVRRRRSHRSLPLPRRSALQGASPTRRCCALHHHRARARRPRSGAPARVGILERPSLARAAHACRSRSSAARSSSTARRTCRRPRCTASRTSGCAAASPRCRRTRGRPRSTPPRRSSRSSAKASLPDIAFANLDGGVFLRARPRQEHLSRSAQQPKIDQCLYLASREMLSQPDAEVRIEIVLSDPTVAPPPAPSDDLVAVVGVLRRQEVAHPRQVGPQGDRRARRSNAWGFIDGTNAFTKTGIVTFRVPQRHARRRGQRRGQLLGARAHRAGRLRPRRAATCSTVTSGCGATIARSGRRRSSRSRFKYRADLQYAEARALVQRLPLSAITRTSRRSSTARSSRSRAVPDEGAALYLGWNGKLPNDPISLYVLLADARRTGSPKIAPTLEFLKSCYAERDAVWEAEQRVVWEYFDGTNWAPLVVIDGTKNFTQLGLRRLRRAGRSQQVAASSPRTASGSARASRWAATSSRRASQRILTNTVEAANVVTIRDEILGSLRRHADPDLRLLAGPAARGRGDRGARAGQPARRGARRSRRRSRCARTATARRPATGCAGAPSRASSTRGRARATTRATRSPGASTFGDGAQGHDAAGGAQQHRRAPLPDRRRRARQRQRHDADAADARDRLHREVLQRHARPPAAPTPRRSTRPRRARRCTLKSRDRAVTAEDFETLALRASTGVARAKCLPSQQHDGEVQVVIVPRGDEQEPRSHQAPGAGAGAACASSRTTSTSGAWSAPCSR